MACSPIDFVWEVLAGRSLPVLPRDSEARTAILHLLRLHRLLGLWYVESGWAEADTADTPRDLSEELRTLQIQRALHTELTLEAADRAREVLDNAGVPSMLFKGAALIRGGVYPGPGARAIGDADVLIPEQDVVGAVRTLEAAGFRPWVPWEDARVGWLAAFTFTDARAPTEFEITLDLHWRIPYRSYRSGEGAFGGREHESGGMWVCADLKRGLPAFEPHFLLLAEHFVRHLRVTPHLVGIGDLVRMSTGDLDAKRLLQLARARPGSLRILRTLLGFIRGELGVHLPGPLVDAISVPERVDGLRGRALDRRRLLDPPGARKEGRIAGLVTQSLAFGSPRTFFGELVDVVHPPEAWLKHRYGSLGAGRLRRRVAHWRAVAGWLAGRGVSPLSPNQEFEDPRR
jgi:Uncharacterised nucleotidyltransferase